MHYGETTAAIVTKLSPFNSRALGSCHWIRQVAAPCNGARDEIWCPTACWVLIWPIRINMVAQNFRLENINVMLLLIGWTTETTSGAQQRGCWLVVCRILASLLAVRAHVTGTSMAGACLKAESNSLICITAKCIHFTHKLTLMCCYYFLCFENCFGTFYRKPDWVSRLFCTDDFCRLPLSYVITYYYFKKETIYRLKIF